MLYLAEERLERLKPQLAKTTTTDTDGNVALQLSSMGISGDLIAEARVACDGVLLSTKTILMALQNTIASMNKAENVLSVHDRTLHKHHS
jgi:hypothetical protein